MDTDETDTAEAAELLDEDDFGGLDLLPPPAPPAPERAGGGGGNAPSPPPPELVAISKRITASTDPLEMQSLVHAALCASIADVLADDKISAADRRREIRVISAAAAKSLPHRRLYEAEQRVIRAEADLERRKRTRAGASSEARPKIGGGGKSIPIRVAPVAGARDVES